jgi:hypothetical protein
MVVLTYHRHKLSDLLNLVALCEIPVSLAHRSTGRRLGHPLVDSGRDGSGRVRLSYVQKGYAEESRLRCIHVRIQLRSVILENLRILILSKIFRISNISTYYKTFKKFKL